MAAKIACAASVIVAYGGVLGDSDIKNLGVQYTVGIHRNVSEGHRRYPGNLKKAAEPNSHSMICEFTDSERNPAAGWRTHAIVIGCVG